MKNTYKNHIAFCIDRSGSMDSLLDATRKVFNNQIEFLRNSSLSFEQETRISFYLFDDQTECVISDVDVARPMELQKIESGGTTALYDCVGLAVQDFKAMPQKYGDHSFIIYILTDGIENASTNYNSASFKTLITKLPDNFTVAAFAPNMNSCMLLEKIGIPKGNIEKWDTTEKGIQEVGAKFSRSMDNFFEARKTGTKSSVSVFSDLSEVKAKDAGKILDKLDKKKYTVLIHEGVKAVQIKDLVESKSKIVYKKGIAFYELVKNEHIQAAKKIAIQNKKTGDIYYGDNARRLLNLPNAEVKVVPGDFGEWIVYVQSTSVNRNVIPKQRILVSEVLA